MCPWERVGDVGTQPRAPSAPAHPRRSGAPRPLWRSPWRRPWRRTHSRDGLGPRSPRTLARFASLRDNAPPLLAAPVNFDPAFGYAPGSRGCPRLAASARLPRTRTFQTHTNCPCQRSTPSPRRRPGSRGPGQRFAPALRRHPAFLRRRKRAARQRRPPERAPRTRPSFCSPFLRARGAWEIACAGASCSRLRNAHAHRPGCCPQVGQARLEYVLAP